MRTITFQQCRTQGHPYQSLSNIRIAGVKGVQVHLTPIPIDEDVSSLSAILLDEDYYAFIHQHKIALDSVQVVTGACLIPLKAKAWLDLSVRKEAGGTVDSRDIKKHKNDVFRLFQIISPDLRVQLPDLISQDMVRFLSAISEDTDLSLKPLGLEGLSVRELVITLKNIYQLSEQTVTERGSNERSQNCTTGAH